MSSSIQSSVAVQVRPCARFISRVAAATVVGLAGIAGALSYNHLRQLAQDYGQAGWHAHAFPFSVDGIEIVASLVLLADRRAGRRSGWLPWTAMAAGTAGSLAANITTAHPDPVSRVIAGWPALALLIASNSFPACSNALASQTFPAQSLITQCGPPPRHQPPPRSPARSRPVHTNPQPTRTTLRKSGPG